MKNRLYIFAAVILLTAGPVISQGHHHNNSGNLWPDSLVTVTVTGSVTIDSGNYHPFYFLDENGDGIVDYQLSFGPWWYEPESGAVRPASGETITVLAAL